MQPRDASAFLLRSSAAGLCDPGRDCCGAVPSPQLPGCCSKQHARLPNLPEGHRPRARSPTLLGPLRSVLRAAAIPAIHAGRIEGSPHDVITNAGKILDATASDQHDRVLLQRMPDSRDVRIDFAPIRETHPRHLSERGVRLFRCRREDTKTHTAPLRRTFEVRGLRPLLLRTTSLSDELLDGRHGCRCPSHHVLSRSGPAVHG